MEEEKGRCTKMEATERPDKDVSACLGARLPLRRPSAEAFLRLSRSFGGNGCRALPRT